MQTSEEMEAARACAVRNKIRQAARRLLIGKGDCTQQLVDAWTYLRPLFPNAVPGQASLPDAQKRDLQSILDAMGGTWGAGANGPCIRRLAKWEDAKVTGAIRRLAASLPADQEEGSPARADQEAPSPSVS